VVPPPEVEEPLPLHIQYLPTVQKIHEEEIRKHPGQPLLSALCGCGATSATFSTEACTLLGGLRDAEDEGNAEEITYYTQRLDKALNERL
jgi:hypothetical protein